MSIRVSKPAVNLREKLSEIDIPTTGSHGSQLMKSVDASESFDLVRAGRKNMIINGAMNINQRNGTSSYTPTNSAATYGGPDRWCVGDWTDGTLSVNMDGDPLNYPATGVAEFQKAMQIACSGTDTSIASAQNTHFFQNIEGYNTTHLQWGTSAAKPVTLSFWVKTNKRGVYSVGLENSDTGRNCIREFYHDGSHTWQKFSLTYPGSTDGTWLKTNGIGIRVRFCLASGTTYDDGIDGIWVSTDELTAGRQTNFMDSTNNRFFLTGVQLEEGTVATPFEHRLYPEELALCQRYYHKVTAADYGNINKLTGPKWQYSIDAGSAAYVRAQVTHPVPMRWPPDVTSIDVSDTGNAVGTQFNGVHSTTIYTNNPGSISSLNVANFDAEL